MLSIVQRPLGQRARQFLFTRRDEDGGHAALRDFDQLLKFADELANVLADDPTSILAGSVLAAYRIAREAKP